MSIVIDHTIRMEIVNTFGSATPALEAMQEYLDNINHLKRIHWFWIDTICLRVDGEEASVHDAQPTRYSSFREEDGNPAPPPHEEWSRESAFGSLIAKIPAGRHVELSIQANIPAEDYRDYGVRYFADFFTRFGTSLHPGDRVTFHGVEYNELFSLLIRGFNTDENGRVYELELTPCAARIQNWGSGYFTIAESGDCSEEETVHNVIRFFRDTLARFSDLEFRYVDLRYMDSTAEEYEYVKDFPDPFDWWVNIDGIRPIKAEQIERVREFLQTTRDFLAPLTEDYHAVATFLSADEDEPFAGLLFYEENGKVVYESYALTEPARA